MVDIALLKKIPLFQGLASTQLTRLAALFEPRTFPAGDFLFREGEVGMEMFVISRGRVRISQNIPGIGEEALAILEEGSCFGEMALVEDGPRSADAIAHSDVVVEAIHKDRLEEAMFLDKELAYVLLWTFVRTLSERLRETNYKMKAFVALSAFK